MRKLVSIDNLSVEVTRKCNLRCDHCLRGEPEQLSLNPLYLKAFFADTGVNDIGYLNITGGEPLMACDVILSCLDIANNLGVTVGSYGMTTNATVHHSNALLTLARVILASDNVMDGLEEAGTSFGISDTPFHHEAIGAAGLDNERALGVKKLQAVFGGDRAYLDPMGGIKHSRDSMLWYRQGRAAKGSIGAKEYDPGVGKLSSVGDSEEYYLCDSELHLNAHGQLVWGGDWSYINQNKHIICNNDDYSGLIGRLIENKYAEVEYDC